MRSRPFAAAPHHTTRAVRLGPARRFQPGQRRRRARGVSGRPCSGPQLCQHRARVLGASGGPASRHGDAQVSQPPHSRAGSEQRRTAICRRAISSTSGICSTWRGRPSPGSAIRTGWAAARGENATRQAPRRRRTGERSRRDSGWHGEVPGADPQPKHADDRAYRSWALAPTIRSSARVLR